MSSIGPDEFNALWQALQDSLKPTELRLSALEASGSRAEVAGAFEVVAALPTAGQPGRALFLSTGQAGLYVDFGYGWIPLGTPIIAKAYRSTNQDVPTGTATIIDFDTVEFDPWNCITTGASWVFTAPVSGYYQVSVFMRSSGSSAWDIGERGSSDLYKNGVVDTRFFVINSIGDGVTNVIMQGGGSTVVYLNAGDTISVSVTQNSGSSISLTGYATDNIRENWICIERIS